MKSVEIFEGCWTISWICRDFKIKNQRTTKRKLSLYQRSKNPIRIGCWTRISNLKRFYEKRSIKSLIKFSYGNIQVEFLLSFQFQSPHQQILLKFEFNLQNHVFDSDWRCILKGRIVRFEIKIKFQRIHNCVEKQALNIQVSMIFQLNKIF